MKPHLNHIAQTLAKKKAIEEAKNVESFYLKYRKTADKLLKDGHSYLSLLEELEDEKERILGDPREGDWLFNEGLRNTQTSSLQAIDRLITELEEEIEGGH